MGDRDCIFCKIAAGEIPSEKLYDDGDVFAVRDINPAAPVHVLIIPYQHIEALRDAGDAEIGVASRCVAAAVAVARQEGIGPGGYRLVVNQGPEAGQEVLHFHMHLLAGRQLGPLG